MIRIVLVFVCLLCVAKASGRVQFAEYSPHRFIGNFTKGGLTLQFDSEVGKLELKDGKGQQLLFVKELDEDTHFVRLLGNHIQDPQKYSGALMAHAAAGSSPEMNLLTEAAIAVGSEGVLGSDHPGIIPLYMAAMHQPTAILTSEALLSNATFLCNSSKIGEQCLGVCGPTCHCWQFVCGDCCYHTGCYCHDLCCTKYLSWGCMFPFSFRCNKGYQCADNAGIPECSKDIDMHNNV